MWYPIVTSHDVSIRYGHNWPHVLLFFFLVTVCVSVCFRIKFHANMTCSNFSWYRAGQEFRVVHAEEDEDEKNLLWLRTSQAVFSMVTVIKVKGSFFGMDYTRSSSKCKMRHKTMAERVDVGHHFENIGTQAGQDEGSCSQTKLR